jgi:hypothetical protein
MADKIKSIQASQQIRKAAVEDTVTRKGVLGLYFNKKPKTTNPSETVNGGASRMPKDPAQSVDKTDAKYRTKGGARSFTFPTASVTAKKKTVDDYVSKNRMPPVQVFATSGYNDKERRQRGM